MREKESSNAPIWAKNVLVAAAVYNVFWGGCVIVAPLALFRWAGMEMPRYPQIWQCVGMIVGVYGIGYWLAARDPFRHWPIVLVGLLGKILGPIGFLNAAISGDLPWAWGATIITNDLIWWIPFASILWLAFRHNSDTSCGTGTPDFKSAIQTARSQRNASLEELSRDAPTLVVFLRHSGCVFCKEALHELAAQRERIESAGATVAIVHMGNPMNGTLMMQKHGLMDVHQFSDPDCTLYRAFGLRRGRLGELFAPSVFPRALGAILQGHGIGVLQGDGFRMPGSFLLIDGKVVQAHQAKTSADHADHLAMIRKYEQCTVPVGA